MKKLLCILAILMMVATCALAESTDVTTTDFVEKYIEVSTTESLMPQLREGDVYDLAKNCMIYAGNNVQITMNKKDGNIITDMKIITFPGSDGKPFQEAYNATLISLCALGISVTIEDAASIASTLRVSADISDIGKEAMDFDMFSIEVQHYGSSGFVVNIFAKG